MNLPELFAKFNHITRSDAAFVIKKYFNFEKWTKERSVKILDVGSGDGSVTKEVIEVHMENILGEITGLDIRQEMVQYANKKYKNSKINFVKFDITSPSTTKIFENEFNIVFSLCCLHLVPNQSAALSNIYNMLKPGGDLVLSLMNRNATFDAYAKLAENPKWSNYMKDYNNFISSYNAEENPEATLSKNLKEAGFIVDECRNEKRSYVFETKEHFKLIKSVCPFNSRIPPDELDQYSEEFVQECSRCETVQKINTGSDSEERFIMNYELLIASASKPREVSSKCKF